jgi:ferredoxin
MIRRVINIDEEACNGCGLCVNACHEGAIGLVNGKAHLMRDDYCDGLGDCLPACPTGAITFVEREAAAYDEAAVLAAKAERQQAAAQVAHAGGCPGSRMQVLKPTGGCPGSRPQVIEQANAAENVQTDSQRPSEISSWPLEIKLVPVSAPYFQGADLLIAADCTAFAYGDFHRDYMRGRTTVIGCPKLDGVDYSEKLGAIIASNDIRSITVARMEVPCCGGLENAARVALSQSGKQIPFNVVTFSVRGDVL